jgi:hydrogenase maturation protease
VTAVRILGIGSPFGDDRVGWAVVDALRAHGLPGRFPAGSIQVECCDRPGARLAALLEGAGHAIVIDAMRTGAAPGTVRRLSAEALEVGSGLLSVHGFGLAEGVALSRALGTLPARLTIFGVELAQTEPGADLSAPVREAVARVVEAIGRALAQPG